MGTPTWYHNGILACCNAHKGKVKVTFNQGAHLPDPDKLFNAGLEGNQRRAIDFFEDEQNRQARTQNADPTRSPTMAAFRRRPRPSQKRAALSHQKPKMLAGRDRARHCSAKKTDRFGAVAEPIRLGGYLRLVSTDSWRSLRVVLEPEIVRSGVAFPEALLANSLIVLPEKSATQM